MGSGEIGGFAAGWFECFITFLPAVFPIESIAAKFSYQVSLSLS